MTRVGVERHLTGRDDSLGLRGGCRRKDSAPTACADGRCGNRRARVWSRWRWPVRAGSGPHGGDLVAVELGQVVTHGD